MQKSAKPSKKKPQVILTKLPGKGKLDPRKLRDLFRKLREERVSLKTGE